MIINKNSWHYKTWLFSYSLWDDVRFVPTNVGLCDYMRRIFMLPFSMILWLLTMAFFLAGFGTIFIFETVFGLLVGYLRTGFALSDRRPYNGLRVGWLELFPIHAILVLALALLIKAFAPTTLSVLIGFSILFFCIGSLLAIAKWWDSDAVRLVKAWFVAKKQGACPILTFKDP